MKPKLAGRSILNISFGLFALLFGSLSAQTSRAQDAKESAEVRPPSPDDSPKSLLPVTAFVGAEIRTSSAEGTIPNGIVLIQGGKILEVGDATLEVPDRATRVDVSGMVMTPGLIDARSLLWLNSPASDTGASDATLNIVDEIDPFADDWHEVIQHGVTTVYVQPSRRGSLSGYGAVLSVAPSESGPTVLADHVALQASLGIGAANNRSRQQQVERTVKTLEAAAEYQKQLKEYEEYQEKQKPAKSEASAGKDVGSKPSGKPATDANSTPPKDAEGKEEPKKEEVQKPDGKTTSDAKPEEKKPDAKPPKKPDADPVKDRLIQVLEGKIPMRIELHSPDDVAFAQKLFENEKFAKVQVIYEGLNNLRTALASVMKSNNPAILGPWLASEPLNAPTNRSQIAWGADFANYGGTVLIASFANSAQGSRMLRAHAAVAIAHGFSSERALKAITIDAARTLGVADQIGSIVKGKRADLVCFAGEPTDPSAAVNIVVSGGEITYEAANLSKASIASTVDAESDTLPLQLPARYSIHSANCLIEGKLQPGTLNVADGKLVSVVAEAASAAVSDIASFDLGNSVIVPGLFSGQATLGLTRLVDPQDLPDSSFVAAADCFLANAEGRQELIDAGLLRVLLSPGNSNPIAGMTSLVRLGAIEPVLEREFASKLVLTAQARDLNRFPSSLAGQNRMLQQALAGELLESRLYLPKSVESNLAARRSAALKAIAAGQRFAWIEAQTDAEIRSAIDLIDRYQLKAALIGPRQLKPFIKRLKELNVAVVVPPILPTTYNWLSADIAEAAQAGVAIMFSGEDAEQLRVSAAYSGLSQSTALLALCDPLATMAGRGAALAADQPADFVIWTQSPVNLAARPLVVVVDGQHASHKLAKSNQLAVDKD
jgi:imidazolonepropionase-like amidohydrolase